MTRWKHTALWILLGSTALGAGELASASGAVVDASSSRRIAERNPFRLRQPEPENRAQSLLPERPTPPLNIEVTGVTDVTGSPRALAEVRLPDQTTRRCILAIGGEFEGIEIRSIDVRNGTVTTRWRGQESRLGLRAGRGSPR